MYTCSTTAAPECSSQCCADTAAGMGADGGVWRALLDRPVRKFDVPTGGVIVKVPRHPLELARFGMPTVLPGSVLARFFRTPQARALWGGIAAHTFRPLNQPLTSAIGLGITTAGHRFGWQVAEADRGRIADVMERTLLELGGRIETGVCVRRSRICHRRM